MSTTMDLEIAIIFLAAVSGVALSLSFYYICKLHKLQKEISLFMDTLQIQNELRSGCFTAYEMMLKEVNKQQ